MKNISTRRDFLQKTIMAAGILPWLMSAESVAKTMNTTGQPAVRIFSKHLQFLDYEAMARAAKSVGFDGVDLTVRPGGHVLPENVERDLPKAIEALHKSGLMCDTIATAVDEAEDPIDRNVLKTAVSQGVKYYRMNWLSYPEGKSIPESDLLFQRQIAALSELNRQLGIIGCYQNHAGHLAGASLYELWDMLRLADPDFMGVQYDIRHATVEGALSWENGLRLVAPKIKTVVIKDFHWIQQDGKWKIENTPLGQGMVDFKTYFGLLKKYEVNAPFILHMEYPLGGAENGATEITIQPEKIYEAMRRDLEFLHKTWQSA